MCARVCWAENTGPPWDLGTSVGDQNGDGGLLCPNVDGTVAAIEAHIKSGAHMKSLQWEKQYLRMKDTALESPAWQHEISEVLRVTYPAARYPEEKDRYKDQGKRRKSRPPVHLERANSSVAEQRSARAGAWRGAAGDNSPSRSSEESGGSSGSRSSSTSRSGSGGAASRLLRGASGERGGASSNEKSNSSNFYHGNPIPIPNRNDDAKLSTDEKKWPAPARTVSRRSSDGRFDVRKPHRPPDVLPDFEHCYDAGTWILDKDVYEVAGLLGYVGTSDGK